MIKSTKQLNEIIRSFSKENANSGISQLAAIIDLCSKAEICFSIDVNYKKELALFYTSKFPEWNAEVTNIEIESLANQGLYEEAAKRRNEAVSLKNEIQRQFRLSKYGTEDWFIEKSDSEIFFIPTDVVVIDSLMSEKAYKK